MSTPASQNNKKSRSSKPKVSVARVASLKALKQVFNGQSLSAVQVHTIELLGDSRDRGLANEIVNGVLRWRWQLEFFVAQLLKKPLKQKDHEVQLILLMALYELNECRTPDYAVINESVELVRKSGKKWAAGLTNAVLRNFTREKQPLTAAIKDGVVRYSHPAWLLEKVKKDWPLQWQAILAANNQRPAFSLRVNQLQYTREQYQQLLTEQGIESCVMALADQALKLTHGMDVRQLPGFAEGAVSVQDVGAQLVAPMLAVSEADRVLDLCAAPGGKTCHLLELYPNLNGLQAVELDEKRMQRVTENLQRLQLQTRAELIVADASDIKSWWQGENFDRILIDAPCSASGVIRRHPDIKSLRRASDIAPLVKLQSEILKAAWQMLIPGGQMLYVTCSIFKDENQHQIQHFLSLHENAVEIEIKADGGNDDWGQACDHGRQLFAGEQDADGFYFCRIQKRE